MASAVAKVRAGGWGSSEALHVQPPSVAKCDAAHRQDIAKAYPGDRRRNPELVIRILREQREGWRLIRAAAPELQADRGVLLAALRCPGGQGWRALAAASPELRADRYLVLEALQLSGGTALEYAAPALREDAALCWEAMESHREVVESCFGKPEGPAWDRIVGQVRAKSGATRTRFSQQGNMKLQSYVAEHNVEACSVLRAEDGQVVPVIAKAILHLRRNDGFIFVQVSTYTEEEGLIVKCQLPEGSILPHEWPREAMTRIVHEQMPPIAKGVQIGEKVRYSMVHGQSKLPSEGIQLRAVISATAVDKFDWTVCFDSVPVSQERQRELWAQMRGHTRPGHSDLIKRFNAEKGAKHMPPDILVLSEGHRDHMELERCLRFYAWLPQWEYEWLQEPDGKAVLGRWMEGLDVGVVVERAYNDPLPEETLAAPVMAAEETHATPRIAGKKAEEVAQKGPHPPPLRPASAIGKRPRWPHARPPSATPRHRSRVVAEAAPEVLWR